MKLAAIYNVWDGEELLMDSMKCLRGYVDLGIIVYQNVSNFGEPHCPMPEKMEPGLANIIFQKYSPREIGGTNNEREKRNIGIEIARYNGCTHFLHVDCDEFYEDFYKLKLEYISKAVPGSVCPIYTYFKKPTWRLQNLDGYFVPFIHELKDDSKAGMSSYPFYVDPTRGINERDVCKLSMPMHHFSWVRKDIERKARNSSAGQHGNKLKGLLDDYHSLDINSDPTGFVIKDMGNQTLIVVDDFFGLNDIFFPPLADKKRIEGG